MNRKSGKDPDTQRGAAQWLPFLRTETEFLCALAVHERKYGDVQAEIRDKRAT